ncbi:YcxB family protein [Flavobacterium chilense]|uniref:YcxB-like protein n=1 Tax=Flavobacterium chilense TaxID=946677 RepID=A0A1M7M0S4_9FLAO|nr:YcxB family protein [Flavobacterium chilense]SHM84264.1 YcxB-like protein [Flavobacterium chilense]
MNSSDFSLQFGLNVSEIQKLNKMYFENIYKDRILLASCAVLFFVIFFDLRSEYDLIEWIIRSLALIIFFLMVQYSFVNSVCKIIFRLAKRFLKSERFVNKYRFHFTGSFICIHSPLGDFTHKWSKIEKAILTKDFLFLYFKERNGYIVSISNKGSNKRNMDELISFVENNVIHIIKV